MASTIYDLRKYHIKTKEDALAFLDLVQSRIPEVTAILKKQSLREASLMNQLAQNRPAPQPVVSSVNQDQSVLERITGSPQRGSSAQEQRLSQLRAANTDTGADEAKQQQIKAAAAALRGDEAKELVTPVVPGEIGNLTIDEGQTTVPVDAVPPAIQEESTAGNDATKSTEEEIAAVAGGPSEADKTSTGTIVAQAQKKANAKK